MRMSISVILATATLALLAGACIGAQIEQFDVPTLPNARLATEINLPPGNILDSLAREYGPWLGMSAIRQISALIYDINPGRQARDILSFYDPTIAAQKWNALVRSADDNQAVAILFNERQGFLIIQVDPPGGNERQATIVRIFGQMDPSKVANSQARLPDLFRKVVESAGTTAEPTSASRIPIGQPISVPPSQRLHIRATRSDIRGQVLGRATAEIRLASRVDDPGELIRIEDRLVLSLTPKLPVSEVLLPGAVPVLLELTEGSANLVCGSASDDRPVKLSIVSTGAPVTLTRFPLSSGTHTVKSVGGEVRIDLSMVQGGVLNVEVTAKNLTLTLPKDVSARIIASVTSGKIENLTGLQAQESAADHMRLVIGLGKAEITLRAVNGNIRISY